MANETQRRLAAIVMADVAGYSRLIGVDETGTLEAMRANRQDVWDPMIERHGGRVANRAGDSALIEFASAVSAMECSVDIQNAMVERNAGLPEDRRILLRVGVNVGEVAVDGEEIHGDGVNVAARLQTLAEPGGIALSGNVQENIANRLDLALVDDGEHRVKNIARPIHVWRWSPESAPVAAGTTAARADNEPPVALADKPSVAVLPFTNMSGDPEQEFFADGIAEDVITELSRFRALRVIARNSTFTYKGEAVNVRKIGRELDTRYVVEGSVRTAANRVRVTAQLIDARSGDHLWADRYDRDLTDIFAVQDEITRSIVAAIAPEVLVAEVASAQRKAPESLSAWECVVRGNTHLWRVTREDFAAALALYDQAIALDPNYAAAHSARATVKVWIATQGWGEGRVSEDMADALASAQRALSLDAGDAMAHFAAGWIYVHMRRFDRAIEEQRAAIALNPGSAEANFGLCLALAHACETEAAFEAIASARQIIPRGPIEPFLTTLEALTHLVAGEYEEAVRLAARALEVRANFFWLQFILAAALGQLGRTDEARDAASRIMRSYPNFSLARHERVVTIGGSEERARYIEGLRKAGLPY